MKYITHPVTVLNLLIVGSFILIEGLHINFHRGLTQCEDSAIIKELDATWE